MDGIAIQTQITVLEVGKEGGRLEDFFHRSGDGGVCRRWRVIVRGTSLALVSKNASAVYMCVRRLFL